MSRPSRMVASVLVGIMTMTNGLFPALLVAQDSKQVMIDDREPPRIELGSYAVGGGAPATPRVRLPDRVRRGAPLPVAATIQDESDLRQVLLQYRAADAIRQPIEMSYIGERSGRKIWSAVIPGDHLVADGILSVSVLAVDEPGNQQRVVANIVVGNITETSTFGSFFGWTLLLGLISGLGYGGYLGYQQWQEQRDESDTQFPQSTIPGPPESAN